MVRKALGCGCLLQRCSCSEDKVFRCRRECCLLSLSLALGNLYSESDLVLEISSPVLSVAALVFSHLRN